MRRIFYSEELERQGNEVSLLISLGSASVFDVYHLPLIVFHFLMLNSEEDVINVFFTPPSTPHLLVCVAVGRAVCHGRRKCQESNPGFLCRAWC